MLCVSTYTHKRRPYSATLYPTSFTLDSLLALTIRAQRQIYGWWYTLSLWLVKEFPCDCMFWENSGGGLTTQPVGTATMMTVTSANGVDLESLSSRCWTFRRTHTSADPLALPLTLSLTSRLAPRARLTVDVPTRAFWLAGISLRRKKRCAGVVGTRIHWALKGEEGGMTTPLLQYARFDGGGEMFGFGGGSYKESWS